MLLCEHLRGMMGSGLGQLGETVRTLKRYLAAPVRVAEIAGNAAFEALPRRHRLYAYKEAILRGLKDVAEVSWEERHKEAIRAYFLDPKVDEVLMREMG